MNVLCFARLTLYTALQSQKAVSPFLKTKQILLFSLYSYMSHSRPIHILLKGGFGPHVNVLPRVVQNRLKKMIMSKTIIYSKRAFDRTPEPPPPGDGSVATATAELNSFCGRFRAGWNLRLSSQQLPSSLSPRASVALVHFDFAAF